MPPSHMRLSVVCAMSVSPLRRHSSRSVGAEISARRRSRRSGRRNWRAGCRAPRAANRATARAARRAPRQRARERLLHFAVLAGDVRLLVTPDRGDALAQVGKAGSPKRAAFGKYVPPKNGVPSGDRNMVSGQPPAAARASGARSGRSDRGRSLFAVHLDVHEQPVHHRRHCRVLEALVRHDVAPVAAE